MKTTAKTLSRRVLGAILALCMLAGLLPMTAFAAAPAPLYADWDGTKAEWVQPAGDYQRIRYHILLVPLTGKNAGYVVFEDKTERTSYDLGSAIRSNGDGDYFFIVQSETGSLSITADPDDPNAKVTWNGDLSDDAQSRTLYSTSVSLEAPSNLRWDGNVVVWESVAGVELYDFRLYRNGEELLQYRATLSPQTHQEVKISFGMALQIRLAESCKITEEIIILRCGRSRNPDTQATGCKARSEV